MILAAISSCSWKFCPEIVDQDQYFYMYVWSLIQNKEFFWRILWLMDLQKLSLTPCRLIFESRTKIPTTNLITPFVYRNAFNCLYLISWWRVSDHRTLVFIIRNHIRDTTTLQNLILASAPSLLFALLKFFSWTSNCYVETDTYWLWTIE